MVTVDNNLTPDPRKSDKLTSDMQIPKSPVKNYASSVFQESSIGMIVSIVATNSRGRKVFKTLILTLCISGFLYQCATYLIHVLQYHTVVNVVIERPESYKIPAYTFCNNNGIKRSVFCDLYPQRCYKPSANFCSETSDYCGSGDTKIPMEDFYNIEDTMSTEEFFKHKDNLQDFLIQEKSKLHDEDSITGPYLRFKKGISGAMICYSLHSVVVSNKYPVLKKRIPSLLDNAPEDKLTFFVPENDTFVPGNRPGILFAIHSPYEAVNPFTKGIFMKPGRTYRIYVSMEKEILLKDPFATRCMDYEEIWEANNHTGARIQEMCQHKCLLDESMSCFNCVYPAVLYPSEGRICNKSETLFECDEKIAQTFKSCWHNCRDDCRVTRYVPKIMETYEVEYAEGKNIKELNQYITVEIRLDDDEMLALKYNPKYMSVEVFSAIGGFLGCWLGISLMDVTDTFGSIFAVSRYACKKKKKSTEANRNNYL